MAAPKNSNKKQKSNAHSTPATSAPTGSQSCNPDERDAAIPDDSMQPMGRPAGRKKEKEKSRQRSDRSQTDALDHLWAKKKETDAEKELKKEERYKVAVSLEQTRIALDKDKFELQRMIEKERILRIDTSAMSIEEQEYYKNLKKCILGLRSAET